jgi:hypothetical protein
MVSRCLSATGTLLLGHPSPARGLGPPHGRLTEHAHRHARTPTGFPRSAHPSRDRGGRPLCPGDGGAHPDRSHFPTGHLPFRNGQSLHPAGPSHRQGSRLTRHQPRVHTCSPVRSSPRLWPPGWNRQPLGLNLGLRTPPAKSRQRTPRWGQAIEHGPGTTAQLTSVDLQSDSSLVVCDLASHVANQSCGAGGA